MADSLLPGDNPSERDEIISKWKDKKPEEILAAKVESDLYIKTLTARLDDIKKDYLDMKERQQASEDLRVILDQIKKERTGQFTDPLPKAPEQPPAIKQEDIEAMIRKHASETFTERERIKYQQDNFNTVQAKLKEVLGPNYESSYKQRLDQLGLSKEFADDLAKNHPSVFMKTFELDKTRTPTNQAPPRNQQMTTSFTPQAPKRDWLYYQELKKSNPRLYLDPKIAIQMHNDAIEQGADFGMPPE